VWHLRLTLHALADAGNLLDTCVLAGLTALRHFRRPEVEVVGDEVTVHPPSARAPIPLALHHSPFCFTFSLYPSAPSVTKAQSGDDDDVRMADTKDGASVSPPTALLDPTTLETTLATGTMSIALNAQRELCVVNKGAAYFFCHCGAVDPLIHLCVISWWIAPDTSANYAPRGHRVCGGQRRGCTGHESVGG
jgi:exosome complex component RRP45